MLKRILSLTLAACMTLSAIGLTSCGKQQPIEEHKEDINQKIELKVDAYRTDLADSSGAMNSNTGIRNYLRSWAESKGVPYTVDRSGNVIMTVKASAYYRKADPVVVVCPYDSSQSQQYMAPMAMALYLAKNNEQTGRLTVVFARENKHDFSGIRGLSSKYFTKDTRVICLNGSGKSQFSMNTGAQMAFHFTQKIRYTKPEYQKAYRISLSGLPGGQVNSDVESQINPAVRLRSLLTSLQSSSIGYDLADFRSGDGGYLLPKDASMTVVIDQDKEQKFIDKMTSLTESFNEDKSNSHPGAEFTFTKVKRPSRVIRPQDTNRFVSFVYTLLNGKYLQEEDGTMKAVNGITSVSTDAHQIEIQSVAYSLTMLSMNEIVKDEKALSKLSDLTFRFGASIPAWSGDPESEFADQISRAYRRYTGKSLTLSDSITSTSANFIRSKSSRAKVISITLNDDVLKTCTGTIIQYLTGLEHTELGLGLTKSDNDDQTENN